MGSIPTEPTPIALTLASASSNRATSQQAPLRVTGDKERSTAVLDTIAGAVTTTTRAVAPTTVMTESRQQMLSDPAVRAEMLSRIPTGRFATPEEVAAAVVYLASPGAASVTGHTLMVDGGLTAY